MSGNTGNNGFAVNHRRRGHVFLLFVAVALVGWAYFPTYASVTQKWVSDTAFSHGFLILPISGWLAWRKRTDLSMVPFQSSVLGVPVMLACALIWAIGRGSGVLVIQQFAVVAMVPALLLAALGWPAVRVLAVPLGFLFFLVPFGRGLVPALMHATADFSTVLLQWSGVPVFRSYMHIVIPEGRFEVARACSGLNYFITSLVLGALYAYLSFRGFLKRLICVAAFAVIPVILNGLRVYITILVSHLTDMRFGPGTEHVTFGRIFFIVMMLAMFWIGRRWHDDPVPTSYVPVAATNHLNGNWVLVMWPLAFACLIAVAASFSVNASLARARLHLADTQSLIDFPAPAAGWESSEGATSQWRPLYRGGITERQARYDDASGSAVDVFVAVYGLGNTVGAEMISHNNIISPDEHGSLAPDVRRRIQLNGGTSLIVKEQLVSDGPVDRLVWHWFMVGERSVVSPFAAKALEAVAFVSRSADSERIVTVSTLLDEKAPQRLEAFIQDHRACAMNGFAGEACRE